MTFYTKSALVTGLSVLTATAFSVWELSKATYKSAQDERRYYIIEQVQQIKKQIENDLTQSANLLAETIQKEMNSSEVSADFKQSPFEALLVLTPSELQISGADWFRSKPTTLTEDLLVSQLKKMNRWPTLNEDVTIYRFEAQNKRIYFGLSTLVQFKSPEKTENKIAIGIVSNTYFQPLFDFIKGSDNEILLLNNEGYALVYPDQQYVGSIATQHPYVQTVKNAEAGLQIFSAENFNKRSTMVGFENLQDAALQLYFATPVLAKSALVVTSIFKVVLFCFVILLVSVGLIYYFGRKNVERIQVLEDNATLLAERAVKSNTVKTFESEQYARLQQKDFSENVVKTLRNPLLVAIGQIQILKSKLAQGEKKLNFDDIEKPLRLSRDFIEQLATHEQVNEPLLGLVEFDRLVASAVTEVAPALKDQSVEVKEEIQSQSEIKISTVDFRTALKNMLLLLAERNGERNGERNVGHEEQKQLLVRTERAGPHIYLKISDNGPMPSSDFLEDFFQPFFVKGLVPTTLKQVVEQAGGSVQACRAPRGGLEINIQLHEPGVMN